ncbi:hypothetical protein CDAR_456211 [Caerostris darwini]|uniref:Uncharacterized protein n=1 Tax=Caerostris darwini TaxID=1538125 RepID=A0AAV4RNF6_9ARAC|nr:hypothetical protein CDAR_456211 [Caerostris darwini]
MQDSSRSRYPWTPRPLTQSVVNLWRRRVLLASIRYNLRPGFANLSCMYLIIDGARCKRKIPTLIVKDFPAI